MTMNCKWPNLSIILMLSSSYPSPVLCAVQCVSALLQELRGSVIWHVQGRIYSQGLEGWEQRRVKLLHIVE